MDAALLVGFKTIYSIELSEFYYNAYKERFKDNKQVYLIFGDFADELPKLLETINERCIFWLDGHWCGDVSACGRNPVPLMDELLAIKKHPIKDYTILIDNMRLLRAHDSEWKDLQYIIF